MSRIGNKIIDIKGVTLDLKNDFVLVNGTLGTIELQLTGDISLSIDNEKNQLTVLRPSDSRKSKSLHGLYRSLLANAVIGVSKGFTRSLFLTGIGYRVQKTGDILVFSLGFSHDVTFPIPQGIDVKVSGQDKFTISGICKQLVGQVCANIKSLPNKDPYKGKGIYDEGETVKKKAGKSVK